MSNFCLGCGLAFVPHPRTRLRQKWCSVECYRVRARVSEANYDKSERAAAVRRAWRERTRESRNAAVREFRKTEEGRVYYDRKNRRNLSRSRARTYGLTEDQLNEILLAGCYAPGCKRTDTLHIDHDHSCCNRIGSCGQCVRGALCASHNTYLGKLEKEPGFAKWVLGGGLPSLELRREA